MVLTIAVYIPAMTPTQTMEAQIGISSMTAFKAKGFSNKYSFEFEIFKLSMSCL